MRCAWLVSAIALAACGADPRAQCDAFQEALCQRVDACGGLSVDECRTALAEEDTACGDVLVAEGDVDECIGETRVQSCEDVTAGRPAASCEGVTFRQ
jgi:hypothetical protein